LSAGQILAAEVRPSIHEVAVRDLGRALAERLASGARYLTSAVADEGAAGGHFRLDWVFARPGAAPPEIVRTPVPAERPEYPSVVPVLPAAHWDEREAQDLFGVVPVGHPDPRRLVLPDDWPEGLHPLRRGVPLQACPPAAPHPGWAARVALGDGVVVMPVGPVHAGIIESGHFAFSLMGETILHLDVRLFWKHRGLEKALEGLPWAEAGPLLERTCVGCSASHQAAWSEAVEQVAGWDLPPRARHLRTVLLECERLWNHINDVAAVPAGTGLTVAAMEGAALKERMLRAQAAAFGHRYLFGTIRPGGTAVDLPADASARLRRELRAIRAALARLGQRMLRHPGFMDRLRGTGVLPARIAADLGAVGPAARASGLAADLRVDRPHLAYAELAPAVVQEDAGDVAARFSLRLREAEVSFELLDRLLRGLPAGPFRTEPPAGAETAGGLGVGASESPRGANVHYVELAEGRIARYRVRSASFANWPLLLQAVPGNLIGDFPLINKSFELCYACCDR